MPFRSDRPAPARRPPTKTAQLQPTKHQVHDTGDAAQLLYTPAEAAALLRVRESWLRRKVAARLIPCTFLGRHLRFSAADLAAIVANHAQPAGVRRRRRRRSTSRDPDLIVAPDRSVDPPDRDDHNRQDGSSTWPG
jgi:excisionase family DNA binding protein